ncbi:rhodanese-like domain-containing protein [Chishuiella sp.]|uniref:rhodanese-like domain-containing protein n=1 Tax=Chishuiella sp. TaxID=1969467 RepID=UPI0028AE8079|nr:rhodanese-like domain-containing protein [Chishuiella sp.]
MENKVIVTLAITTSLIFGSCSNKVIPVNNQNQQETLVTLNHVHQIDLTNKNNILIDVRTEDEYAEGHLPQSINIDVKNSDFENQIQKLDPKKNYYLYCRSGVRAKLATEKMQEKGFKKVYNFQDGISTYNGKIEK